MNKNDILLTTKYSTKLIELLTLMTTEGRKQLLNDKKVTWLTDIVITHPEKPSKNIKVFEGYHLKEFAQYKTPTKKYVDGNTLRNMLLSKFGNASSLDTFSTTLSMSFELVEKLFDSLCEVLRISKVQCFLEFLEFCEKEHRPLRIFDNDKQREAFIADLREYYEQAKSNKNKIPPNPYKGLEVFGLEDQEFFFGRDKWIQKICRKFDKAPFLAIIGASGSGKSSLMLAGVAPKLIEEDWLFIHFRPSSSTSNDPFFALASALVPFYFEDDNFSGKAKEQENIAIELKNGSVSLTTYIDAIKDKNKNKKTLIYIDQFEELFTMQAPSEDISAFITLLVDFYQSVYRKTDIQTVVALTMRCDFLLNTNAYEEFSELISQHEVIINPPKKNDLRQAIEMPADFFDVDFDEGLIDSILIDAEYLTGGLPLVEYALTELWETQIDSLISHSSYHKIGRISGALSQRAENVFYQFNQREQEDAELIFIKLVSAKDGNFDTRRVATRSEFSNDQWKLIHRLSSQKQRLLVANFDEDHNTVATVEISHETLLTQWDRLRGWLEKNRSFLIWRSELSSLMKPWLENKDKRNLLRGDALFDAEQWLKKRSDKLDSLENDFIQNSINYANIKKNHRKEKKAKAERNKKIRMIISVGVIIVLVGLSFMLNSALEIARLQTKTAFDERNRAQINERRFIAKKAGEYVKRGENRPAALLALEALKELNGADVIDTDYGRESINILKKLNGKYLETNRIQIDGNTRDFDISPDGKLLVTATSNGKVSVWDIDTGNKLLVNNNRAKALKYIAFSPTGSAIFLILDDGTMELWELSSGAILKISLKNGKTFKTVKFYKNSDIVITQNDDWEVSISQLSLFLHDKESIPINSWVSKSFYFDDEKSTLWLSKYEDLKKVIIKDNTYHLEKEWHLGGVDEITFSTSGKYVLLRLKNSTYQIGLTDNIGKPDQFSDLTIEDKDSGRRLLWATGLVPDIIFDESGSTVIIGNTRDVSAFDIHTGNRIKVFDKGKFLQGHIDLSADRSKLLTYTYGNETYVSDYVSSNSISMLDDLDNRKKIILPNEKTLPKFVGNSTAIAVLDADNIIRFWSQTVFLKDQVILIGDGEEVGCTNFSNDSSMVVNCTHENNIRISDKESGELKNVLKGHKKKVYSAIFNHNDTRVITASLDGTARLWNVSTGKEIYRIDAKRPIQLAFFSNDETSIIAIGYKSDFYPKQNFFDYHFEKDIDQLESHIINNVDFNSLGDLFEQVDNKLSIFTLNYSLLFRFVKQSDSRNNFFYRYTEGESRAYGPIAISNNGKFAAQAVSPINRKNVDSSKASKFEGIIVTNNLGEEIHNLNDGTIDALGFSENNQYIYAIGKENINIFNMHSGKKINSIPYEIDKEIEEEIDGYFSYDAKYFFIGSEKRIQIWNALTSELVFEYYTSEETISNVIVSPDSKNVMWSEKDGRVIISPIRLYDNNKLINDYRNLGIPPMTPEERKVFFSSN